MSGPKEVAVGASEPVASPAPSAATGPGGGKEAEKRQGTAAGMEPKGAKLSVVFETKGPGK